MMANEQLDKLKRLLDKVTTRPWDATTRQGSWDWLIFAPGTPYEICQMFHEGTDGNEEGEANAELIVSAVNALPELIACAEALQVLFDFFESEGEFNEEEASLVSDQARAALAQLDKETSGT